VTNPICWTCKNC